MAWFILTGAIVIEVAATLALRASDGLTRLGPSAGALAGYALAFLLFAQALRTIGVGPAYATWSGLGIVGVALGGWALYAERLSPLMLVGTALIILGVVVMNLGGETSRA